MQCSSSRVMAPASLRGLPSRVPRVNSGSLRHRCIIRSVLPNNAECPEAYEPSRPLSGVAQLAAGAAMAWALLSGDQAQAADSSGRISGSTFASRRTAVQANGYNTGTAELAPSSAASFTRNSSNLNTTNLNNNTTNISNNTTNVSNNTTHISNNTTSVNHTTTHVNHTTVVMAPPTPVIPIPVMVPVSTPAVVVEPAAVAVASPAVAVSTTPVVVTHQSSSMVTTVIGLLAVVLLLYIISQVISAFSGNRF